MESIKAVLFLLLELLPKSGVALAILWFFWGYPSLAWFLILFHDQQVIFQKGILKLQGLRHVFSNRSGFFNSTLPRSYQCLISPTVEVLYLKMGKTDPLSSASAGNSLLPDWTPFWKMLVQNRPFGILGHGLHGGNKNILPS